MPDFLTKHKKVYEDPVIDPRESWKDWAKRQLEFKDPPLVERKELPEELQPQNRTFGRLSYMLSRSAMTPLTQKPNFERPQRVMSEHGAATASNLQSGEVITKDDIEMQTVS